MTGYPLLFGLRLLSSRCISNTEFHLWMDHTRRELIASSWLEILCIWIIYLRRWDIVLKERIAHYLLFMITSILVQLLSFLAGLAVLKLCCSLTLWLDISTLENIHLNILLNSFTFFDSLCSIDLSSLFFNSSLLVVNIDVDYIIFVELLGPSLGDTVLHLVLKLLSIWTLG